MDMGKLMVKVFFFNLIRLSKREPKKKMQQRREMNWISFFFNLLFLFLFKYG